MYGRTDTITRNNEPLFKLVLWFVLGRGSIINPYAHVMYMCIEMLLAGLVYLLEYSKLSNYPKTGKWKIIINHINYCRNVNSAS